MIAQMPNCPNGTPEPKHRFSGTDDFYTTVISTVISTASNIANDTWIDCSATWSEITVTLTGVAVPQKQAKKEKPPPFRPPRPRRSFRPPAVSTTFARRPVNRHPSARRAFRY